MNHEEQNALMPHSTITELVGIYKQAEADIRAGLEAITGAQERLGKFFDGKGYGFSICQSSHDLPDPDEAMGRVHKQVWRNIVNRLELRKLLSTSRIDELDKQLETGKDLPPITVENVIAMLESNLNNAGQYLEEKIRETYEWLRPTRSELKTNQKSVLQGIGRKVILTWNIVRPSYSGRGFEANYGRQDKLRALDQVFHLLDGKPALEGSYRGELVDELEKQTKETGCEFTTPYFRGKCYGNGNLHLEILREDLLDEFNRVAGGAHLQARNPERKQSAQTTPKTEPAGREMELALPFSELKG